MSNQGHPGFAPFIRAEMKGGTIYTWMGRTLNDQLLISSSLSWLLFLFGAISHLSIEKSGLTTGTC